MAASARRVLVIEDEMLPAMLLESLVSGLGYAVVGPAGRAEQAMALVDDERPDAAILDINLHGKSAFPLASALAERAIPFAFVTGYERDQLPAEWRARPLLQKPFTRAGLAQTLTTLLAA